MIAGCCRSLLLFILFQIKIIISIEMAAVVMNRITKTDEATVTKMIVLSCNVELMLEVGRVVIEANDIFEVDPAELLVGLTVTVEFISSGWPIQK